MSSNAPAELRLAAESDEALQAVLAALPKDAVVRDEEDGLGRFAGQRTVAMVDRRHGRLMLFEGSWGDIKARIDKGQVEIAFEKVPQGTIARVSKDPVTPPGLKDHVLDVISQGVTVAALVVAYHFVKGLPVDYTLVAGIGLGGGIAWSVVASLLPKKTRPGLDDTVRKALEPFEAAADVTGDGDDDEAEDQR